MRCCITYSTRFFVLLPNEDPPSLAPDLLLSISSADFRAGRDPVLEAIVADSGL